MNKIRYINLGIHEEVFSSLKEKWYSCCFDDRVIYELIMQIVDAFDTNKEGIIIVPKGKKK